ncbi:MAG: hypothetical protein ACJAY5_001133 [Actinomycetes bacterium]|jgi:hypothetical protein
MNDNRELRIGVIMEIDTATNSAVAVRPSDCSAADLTELTLEQLRSCRKALTTREAQVSYWRRIIQARLDLARDSAIRGAATVEGLERILTRHLGGNQRLGVLSVQPTDVAPIDGLDHLWSRSIGIESPVGGELEADLIAAERKLSALRAGLHSQIDAATAEMIARYRADPQLAFSALPRRDSRPAPL